MKLLPSFFFIVLLALQANAQSLQRVAPEQVGMDSRHLLYADEAIETAIANKDIPGAVLAEYVTGRWPTSKHTATSVCTLTPSL